MQYHEYLLQKKQLTRQVLSATNPATDPLLQTQFTLVSAGLHNYLPDIPFGEHQTIFKHIHLYRQLSELEQHCASLVGEMQYPGLGDAHFNLLRKGCILCTYHTGSYRAINLFLLHHRIPFTLVVAGRVLQEKGEQLKAAFRQQKPEGYSEENFTLIDAEAPGAAIRLLRQLKAGRVLVMYIDGNTGSGAPTAGNENACIVPFLGQRLFARSGIAYLAYTAGVPVVPVISYRETYSRICLRFHQPVTAGHGTGREGFVAATTQYLYQLLAGVVQSYPAQWEAWLYLHNMVNIVQVKEPEPLYMPAPLPGNGMLRFNCAEFGIFKADEDYLLFRKSGYLSYPINLELYNLLSHAARTPVERKETNRQLLDLLYVNRVLVCT